MNESTRLQALLDVLTQAVVCHNPDGTLGAINDAAQHLLRCRRENVIGYNWSDGPWTTVDSEDREVAESQWPGRRALATGQGILNTLVGIRANPNESRIWLNTDTVLVPTGTDPSKQAAVVVLEPMVAVSQGHPAAAALDRMSQVPPSQRRFLRRADMESRHRALFEQSKCVMLIVHPVTGRILDANQAAHEFYGYSRRALVQMNIHDINTLPKATVRKEMGRARSRDSGRFRFRHRLASGELRDVEVYSSPIPIEGEKVLHSIIHDVTKRENARQQIQERNWELRSVNAIITAAVHGSSPARLLRMVCSELCEHLNAKEVVAVLFEPLANGASIIATSSGDAQDARVGRELDTALERTLREGIAAGAPWLTEASKLEALLRPRADTQVEPPNSLLLLPLVTTDETLGALILASPTEGQFRDMALRAFGQRLADQVSRALLIAEIEQTRRRLLAAIEQNTDVVVITEVDGTIVYANAAFGRLTGKRANRRSELRVPDVFGTPDLAKAWTTVTAGGTWSGSFSTTRNDGSRLDADAVISPVRDDAGEIVNIIAVARDVTRERQLQQQVVQAQKMESIGRLAGGLAHDFNNTLAAVMGYTGLVRARLAPEHPAQNDIAEIHETILRASNLSRQLLTFARRQTTELKPLDLNELILNLDGMLRRLIGEDIELVTAPDPALRRTVGERGQLEQVIVNIVVNARDAMPDGGKIVIETRNVVRDADELAGYPDTQPGEYVQLSIRDNGIGMSDEVKLHLFEPFFTTKSSDKGTGLGLATCFGIVRQYSGYVAADSEVDAGTTIHVYLPATTRFQSAPPSERFPVAVPTGNETVLVVEDDPTVRRMAIRLLGNGGYRVLEATNGEEALRVSARYEGTIDVLLTDVVMPRMGARELIEEMKKRRPEIKVLVMSGYADDAQLRERAGERQIPFLSKPFTEAMLMHKLRNLLDR